MDEELQACENNGKVEASDTFRRVLEQLNITPCGPLNPENLAVLDGVSHKRTNEDPVQEITEPEEEPFRRRRSTICSADLPMTSKKTGIPKSVRHLRRKSVHWIDESSIVPIAHEPTPEERHGARIFMKTIPKSILKSTDSLDNLMIVSE